jgi:hypothetical protein
MSLCLLLGTSIKQDQSIAPACLDLRHPGVVACRRRHELGRADAGLFAVALQAVGLQAEVLAPHSNGSKPPAERQPCTCVSVDGGAAQLR